MFLQHDPGLPTFTENISLKDGTFKAPNGRAENMMVMIGMRSASRRAFRRDIGIQEMPMGERR